MWKFQITQKFAQFLPTFSSCSAEKGRQESSKFLGYFKFTHQPYKNGLYLECLSENFFVRASKSKNCDNVFCLQKIAYVA